jgi:hypothetical protein
MIIGIIIALVLMIIGYFLMPKPKAATPDAVQQLEAPTADAGIPWAVMFGDMTLKSPNFLWYGDIRNVRKKKKSKKK